MVRLVDWEDGIATNAWWTTSRGEGKVKSAHCRDAPRELPVRFSGEPSALVNSRSRSAISTAAARTELVELFENA